VEKCRSEDEKREGDQNIFDGDQLIGGEVAEGWWRGKKVRGAANARTGETNVARGAGTRRGKKKALCGNRRPSNDCLPYEKSSKIDVGVSLSPIRLCPFFAASDHKDNDQEILLKELNDTITLNC
jgi:hypothetical protein